MKKTERINLHFSQKEIEKIGQNSNIDLPIEGQMKRKQLANFVRNAALGNKTQVISPIAREQMRDLSLLGSNLNQISHRINTDYLEVDLNELNSLLKKIKLKILDIHES